MIELTEQQVQALAHPGAAPARRSAASSSTLSRLAVNWGKGNGDMLLLDDMRPKRKTLAVASPHFASAAERLSPVCLVGWSECALAEREEFASVHIWHTATRP